MIFVSSFAHGNNGGVHGPIVKANTQQFDWRITHSPADQDGAQDLWAQRVHYQHALNNRWRVRIVGQYRKQPDWDYDSAKIEMLYNFNKFGENDNFASAVRLDYRTRRGSRPDDIAIHWTNQFNFDAKNFVRAIMIVGKNVSGTQSRDVRIATRFAYYHRLNSTYQVGLELFDQYGQISNIADYDEQRHQVGPAVMAKFGKFQVFARYLAGLTDSTPNNNFSMRLIYNF
ncbi:hypothetical protein ACFO4O_09530 [Glaciecola siphonariae]|uniref:Alginate export domain-containing protein n=1 Tax=Glaciecola siphonariae TaxID=521012 RepID=A0ABV9LV51_9ALTE